MTTDIVIATQNRRALLKSTVGCIVERTHSSYRLMVIDDGSDREDAAYVQALRERRWVAYVLRRERPAGIAANLRQLLGVAKTDPFVFTDDDVLCPDVAPDWLARLQEAMACRPQLGILALNDPQCALNNSRGDLTPDGDVVMCRNVPGHLVLIRRAVLEAITVPDGVHSPVKRLCIDARNAGWQVGYLRDTYCQHIGRYSIRWHAKDYQSDLEQVLPVDGKTLEPPEAYRE